MLKKNFDPNERDVDRLIRAFPSGLTSDVRVVAAAIPFSSNPIRLSDGNVHYIDMFVSTRKPKLLSMEPHNEMIQLPYRVYFDEPAHGDIQHLPVLQRVVLHCIYSRHHDGHVRQKHVEHLRGHDEHFIVPFAIQLLGEYVIEILETLEEIFQGSFLDKCAEFLDANQFYWKQTQSRVVSYWDAYYQNKYPDLRDYVGKRLVNKLNEGIKAFNR